MELVTAAGNWGSILHLRTSSQCQRRGVSICHHQLHWSVVVPPGLTTDLLAKALECGGKPWAEGKSRGEQLSQGVSTCSKPVARMSEE